MRGGGEGDSEGGIPDLNFDAKRGGLPECISRFVALHPGTPSAHQSYLTLTNLFHVLEAEKTRLLTILSTRPSHRPYIYPRWSSPCPSPPKAHKDAPPPFESTAMKEVPLAFPGEMRKKHNWLETGSLEDLRAINKERW